MARRGWFLAVLLTAIALPAPAQAAFTGGRRSIWQLQDFEIRDGGGAPFLRQGLFVP